MSKRTKPKHVLEYVPVRVFQKIMELLPHRVALFKGATLGSIAFSILKIRRNVSLGNLRIAFPENSERENTMIARRAYRNFGMTVAEICRFRRYNCKVIDKLITFEGIENVDKARSEEKGVLLLAGHFGSWELYGSLTKIGYPVTFMVGEQHNILVDRLINSMREALGINVCPLTGDLRAIIKALRSNDVVCFLIDQDARRSGVFVDFFGRKASTPFGAARLSMLTGAPVIMGGVVRQPGGRHRVVAGDPIFPSGERGDEEVARLTQAYTTKLEELIRLHPDQYFWPHKRWKTRPEGEQVQK